MSAGPRVSGRPPTAWPGQRWCEPAEGVPCARTPQWVVFCWWITGTCPVLETSVHAISRWARSPARAHVAIPCPSVSDGTCIPCGEKL